MLDAGDPQQMLGYTYANDNPVSGSDPTGLMNADDGDGGGGYTDDDVDKLYPVAGAVNDNPNPHRGDDGGGTNNDNGGGSNHAGGGSNHAGGGDHHKKSGGIGGWFKKRVNDANDKVDEAHDWAKDHASEIGNAVAISVAAFCGATAGIGCLIAAGAVMGAAGASLGYGARIALDDQESFSTSNFAREVVTGAATGAAGSALGVGAGAVAGRASSAAGLAGKSLLGKVGSKATARGTNHALALIRSGFWYSLRLTVRPGPGRGKVCGPRFSSCDVTLSRSATSCAVWGRDLTPTCVPADGRTGISSMC